MVEQKQYYNELVKFIKTFIHKPGNFGWDDAQKLCRYRTPEGKACAIGQYIPKDKYEPGIEGMGVGGSYFKTFEKFLPFGNEREFWSKLQSTHDDFAMENVTIRNGSRLISKLAKMFCPDYENKLIGLYYAW